MASKKLLFKWRAELLLADELSAADRHIAHIIGFHADEHGHGAYPSIATIAAETALTKGTVLDSLGWLEAAGWLASRSRGRRSTKLYSPLIPVDRKSRDDRACWASERKRRLLTARLSRSESLPTQPVGMATH